MVEDERDLRLLAVTVLELAGDIEVIGQTDTAEEGLWLCGRLRPDVLVTDLRLPGMSGEELIAAVNERHPELPIVVHSAYADAAEVARTRAQGVCEVVPKEAVGLLADAVRGCWSGSLADVSG